MAKTTRTNKTETVTAVFGSVNFDAKGRELGLIVETFECDFIDGAAEGAYWWNVAAGHKFAARVQSAKDGKAWGATQGVNYFETAEERAEYIAKRQKKAGVLVWEPSGETLDEIIASDMSKRK